MLTHQTALFVIDFQIDFLATDGRFPVAAHQVEPMLNATNQLIDAALSSGTLIVYIGNEYGPRSFENIFRNNAAIKGSAGMQLDPRLSRVSNHYFSKDKTSAFTNSRLNDFLRTQDINQLWLTGVYASACVRATAINGLKNGYEVGIVSDAIADKNDQRRDTALHALERKGASVLTSEDLLTQHLEVQAGPVSIGR